MTALVAPLGVLPRVSDEMLETVERELAKPENTDFVKRLIDELHAAAWHESHGTPRPDRDEAQG